MFENFDGFEVQPSMVMLTGSEEFDFLKLDGVISIDLQGMLRYRGFFGLTLA